MDNDTVETLQDSVRHWIRLSECVTLNQIKAEGGIGSTSCALCHKYGAGCGISSDDDATAIDWCPVATESEDTGCDNTPHKRVARAYSTLRTTLEHSDVRIINEWQSATRVQAMYLNSLLPVVNQRRALIALWSVYQNADENPGKVEYRELHEPFQSFHQVQQPSWDWTRYTYRFIRSRIQKAPHYMYVVMPKSANDYDPTKAVLAYPLAAQATMNPTTEQVHKYVYQPED